MDRAGRMVIPKQVRDAAGLRAGKVQLDVVGTTVTISVPPSPLVERDGLLVLAEGIGLDDDQIRRMRLDAQR
ncbi:MAG: AbrB/MazE/SpoVT family DNA-binding domain-containing protein [Actinomycetia bacterium]|nr:AbrB/MazE/SpoVT family DNA-binding domain-containing protein [Actinomycetes bacterium]